MCFFVSPFLGHNYTLIADFNIEWTNITIICLLRANQLIM